MTEVAPQTRSEHVVDAAVLQAGIDLAGTSQRFGRAVVRHLDQHLMHATHAVAQGARHAFAQNEKLGNPTRRDQITIDLAIDLEGRHRAQ